LWERILFCSIIQLSVVHTETKVSSGQAQRVMTKYCPTL
jgi:hypothetical protein